MRTIPWRQVRCFVLVLLTLLGGSAYALLQEVAQPEKLLAVADELAPVVSRLRGLELKASIQKGVKTREEISKFITEEASGRYEKDELRNQGVLLKKLGLIPADMDYSAFTLKLLTEQLGGFYDPEKKAFYIAGWLPIEQQKPAMVHELTHALQDQYFDLEGMLKRDRKLHDSDAALAHLAIAEGDATAVMIDYILQPAGRSFVQLPDLVFIMRTQMSLMNSQFEVLKSAPDYVKESLVFPYSYGAAFLQKVRSHNEPWSVVDKIYAHLPSSTEQIIHAEKYLGERDEPKPVTVEDPATLLGKDWKVTYRDVLGEFSLYLLLKVTLSEEQAMSAANGWGGDQVILVEEGGGKQSSAVFVESVWDNQECADRFFGALSGWLHRRFPQARKLEDSENLIALVSGGEYRSIRRKGTSVRLILGLPESFADKFNNR